MTDPAAALDAITESDLSVSGWLGYDDDWLDPWSFATPIGLPDRTVIKVDAQSDHDS